MKQNINEINKFEQVTNEELSTWEDLTEPQYIPTHIKDICASLIHKRIVVEVQEIGLQHQKSLPKTFRTTCHRCMLSVNQDIERMIGKWLMNLVVSDEANKKILFKQLQHSFQISNGPCDGNKLHKLYTEVFDYTDYSILLVKDVLKKNDKFVLQDYKPIFVYLIGQLPSTDKKYKIYGYVETHPKTNDLCIIGERIEPIQDAFFKYSINEEDKKDFFHYFRNTPLGCQVATHIVGEKRLLAKKWVDLSLHSPAQLPDIDGTEIRGTLNVVLYGDTKAGKSEIGKDFTDKGRSGLPLGEYVSCETGSRTGILYTIDTDKGLLTWGVMVTNDMGMVFIDAMQQMTHIEYGEFLETMNNQSVTVRRSMSGDAPARVRIISAINPRKPMNQYIFPCEAILDSSVFKYPQAITRWDGYVSFSHGDVTPEEVNKQKDIEKPIPSEVWKKHIAWVWSRKIYNIEYTKDAKDEIVKISNTLIKEYLVEQLPIIHMGIRSTMCRMSVAYAARMHSTNETHTNIFVEKDHVIKSFELMKETLNSLQVKEYKAAIEEKFSLTDLELAEIVGNINSQELTILQELMKGPISSSVLETKLGKSDRTIKEYYNTLKEYGLITTKPGIGAILSPKGIVFIKNLLSLKKDGEIVKKNFTNENI